MYSEKEKKTLKKTRRYSNLSLVQKLMKSNFDQNSPEKKINRSNSVNFRDRLKPNPKKISRKYEQVSQLEKERRRFESMINSKEMHNLVNLKRNMDGIGDEKIEEDYR